MRRAANVRRRFPASGQQRVHPGRKQIKAPIKGLNTIDAYDSMKPGYAIALDNFWPNLGKLDLRQGYSRYLEETEKLSSTHPVTAIFNHPANHGIFSMLSLRILYGI